MRARTTCSDAQIRPCTTRRSRGRIGSYRWRSSSARLLVLLLALQNPGPELYYSVTAPTARSAYLVEVEITNPPSPSRLVIPSWAPGAYRLMDSWQNIRDVAAVSGAGDPLPVHQDTPSSWVIDPKGNARITVRYTAGLRDSVPWRHPNNRWFLRASSGGLDGPRTFMYLDGWKQTPARVNFPGPPGRPIAPRPG